MLWANLRVSDKVKDLFDKEGSILKKDYMICVYMYVCVWHTHIHNLKHLFTKKKRTPVGKNGERIYTSN